jgi:hypothetical protein
MGPRPIPTLRSEDETRHSRNWLHCHVKCDTVNVTFPGPMAVGSCGHKAARPERSCPGTNTSGQDRATPWPDTDSGVARAFLSGGVWQHTVQPRLAPTCVESDRLRRHPAIESDSEGPTLTRLQGTGGHCRVSGVYHAGAASRIGGSSHWHPKRKAQHCSAAGRTAVAVRPLQCISSALSHVYYAAGIQAVPGPSRGSCARQIVPCSVQFRVSNIRTSGDQQANFRALRSLMH